MRHKDTYFIVLHDDNGGVGIGECALFRGLSCDDRPDYEQRLSEVCHEIEEGGMPDLTHWPSIRMGVETAMTSLSSANPFLLFPSRWTDGLDSIKINGLVWMGSADEMTARVAEKLLAGFRCVKLKIGGIAFEQELEIIAALRRQFSPEQLEIRLDANGGFSADNALQRLEALSRYHIHSLEQPIKPGNEQVMAEICRQSPIDIALDESLIGVNDRADKVRLLQAVMPRYVIIKPSLVGGLAGSEEWIEAANGLGIGWWATSALESNIGLNAIAQWCYKQHPTMPQGLGTGQLYYNNIVSPLTMRGDSIVYNPATPWQLPAEFNQ